MANNNDDEQDKTLPPVFDIVPKNPPPSIVVTTPSNNLKRVNSDLSLSSDPYNSVAGEHECKPCPQGHKNASHAEILPNVASILNNNILNGLLKSDSSRNETEAFVPVGGMVAPEKKRQEFVTYLQKKGFISTIAKVLVSLYEENELPPKETVTRYIAKCMGFHLTATNELAETNAYGQILRVRIQRLQVENDWMRRHLDNYEATETPLDIVDPSSLPPIQYQKLDLQHEHHGHQYHRHKSHHHKGEHK